MTHTFMAAVLCVGVSVSLAAQSTESPPPQTARQALIEMFLAKSPSAFLTHLPDAAKQTLVHKSDTPETSILLKFSGAAREFGAQGGQLETFDVGPNIMVTEEKSSHERVEIAVEHDVSNGEEDEIELSVHVFKDGQPESLPVIPRLIFTFKQEKVIWKLTELTAAAHVPLTDPDYLKELRKEQNESNERAMQWQIMEIVKAETTYAASHPEAGYSCNMASLFPPPAAGDENNNASSPLGENNDYNGFHIELSGCAGAPSLKYRLSATPLDHDSEMKTFCTDESGTLKSLDGGKASSCFTRGEIVKSTTSAAAATD